MAEYIEREKLMEKFCWHCEATACGDDECFYKRVMYSIPAADIQPVVRCNECKLYDGVHNVRGVAPCLYWMHMTIWDDYCSHGVRMDGET